jgi:hypothetical protein
MLNTKHYERPEPPGALPFRRLSLTLAALVLLDLPETAAAPSSRQGQGAERLATKLAFRVDEFRLQICCFEPIRSRTNQL